MSDERWPFLVDPRPWTGHLVEALRMPPQFPRVDFELYGPAQNRVTVQSAIDIFADQSVLMICRHFKSGKPMEWVVDGVATVLGGVLVNGHSDMKGLAARKSWPRSFQLSKWNIAVRGARPQYAVEWSIDIAAIDPRGA